MRLVPAGTNRPEPIYNPDGRQEPILLNCIVPNSRLKSRSARWIALTCLVLVFGSQLYRSANEMARQEIERLVVQSLAKSTTSDSNHGAFDDPGDGSIVGATCQIESVQIGWWNTKINQVDLRGADGGVVLICPGIAVDYSPWRMLTSSNGSFDQVEFVSPKIEIDFNRIDRLPDLFSSDGDAREIPKIKIANGAAILRRKSADTFSIDGINVAIAAAKNDIHASIAFDELLGGQVKFDLDLTQDGSTWSGDLDVDAVDTQLEQICDFVGIPVDLRGPATFRGPVRLRLTDESYEMDAVFDGMAREFSVETIPASEVKTRVCLDRIVHFYDADRRPRNTGKVVVDCTAGGEDLGAIVESVGRRYRVPVPQVSGDADVVVHVEVFQDQTNRNEPFFANIDVDSNRWNLTEIPFNRLETRMCLYADRYEILSADATSPESEQLQVAGVIDWSDAKNTTFDLTRGSLSASLLRHYVGVTDIAVGGNLEVSGRLSAVRDLDGEIVTTATGRVTSPEFSIDAFSFGDASGEIQFADDLLTLQNVSADFLDGKASAAIGVQLKDHLFDLETSIYSIDIGRLFAEFGPRLDPATYKTFSQWLDSSGGKIGGSVDGSWRFQSANPNRDQPRMISVGISGAVLALPQLIAQNIESSVHLAGDNAVAVFNAQIADGSVRLEAPFSVEQWRRREGAVSVRSVASSASLSQLIEMATGNRSPLDIDGNIDGEIEWKVPLDPATEILENLTATGSFEVRRMGIGRAPLANRLQADFQLENATVRVSDLTGTIAGGLATGSLEIPVAISGEDRQAGHFRFRIRQAELATLVQLVNRVGGNGRVQRIPSRGQGEYVRGTLSLENSGTIAWNNGRLEGQARSLVQIDGGQAFGTAFQMRPTPVDWAFDTWRSRFDVGATRMVVEAFGGSIESTFDMSIGKRSRFDLQSKISNLETSQLFRNFSTSSIQDHGRLDGELGLSASRLATIRDLRGELTGSISRSNAFRLPVFRGLDQRINQAGIARHRFDDGSFDIRLRGDRVDVNRIVFADEAIQVMVDGSAVLGGRLDLNAVAHVGQTRPDPLFRLLTSPVMQTTAPVVAQVARAERLLAERMLFFEIGGTLERPIVRVQTRKLFRQELVQFILGKTYNLSGSERSILNRGLFQQR